VKYTVTPLIPPPGRVKGCLLRTTKLGDLCPLARDHIKIIPRGEWAGIIEQRAADELEVRDLVKDILDQNGYGSCASEEVAQGLMTTRAFEGQPHVLLSPCSLYAFLCGGRDAGSGIGENWARARDVGIMPMSEWPRSKGWRAKPSPDQLKEHASKYRLDEFYDIENTDELVSALLSGFVVGYGRSGHAILAVDMLDTSHFLYANSWGDWGDQGFGIDRITNVNWGYGAFAARSTVTSGGL